jgi:poly(3-hydroxybutyrate) depolymerase
MAIEEMDDRATPDDGARSDSPVRSTGSDADRSIGIRTMADRTSDDRTDGDRIDRDRDRTTGDRRIEDRTMSDRTTGDDVGRCGSPSRADPAVDSDPVRDADPVRRPRAVTIPGRWMPIATVLVLALAACRLAESPPAAAQSRDSRTTASSSDARPGQRAGTFSGTAAARPVAWKYLLHLPRSYAEADTARWPMIVYLHGGSMRGDDPERLRQAGLPRVADGDPGFPFVVLSPQLPAGEQWSDPEALVALIDHVQGTHRIDPTRIYLTGHSLGGAGTWLAAYRYPDRFAAIAPMAGFGVPWWSLTLRRTPARVVHGDQDTIVPLRESTEIVDALRRDGGEAELVVLAGRGHFILDAYEDPALYAWLLRHRKP